LLVAKRNADAVRWLIDRGVDVNAKRVLWDCNHTALHVTQIADLLRQRGATT